jgi:hypothetical protein
MTLPSDEELRLNVQAMRDRAAQLRAWGDATKPGRMRYGLHRAARDLTNGADELEAAIMATQPEKAA